MNTIVIKVGPHFMQMDTPVYETSDSNEARGVKYQKLSSMAEAEKFLKTKNQKIRKTCYFHKCMACRCLGTSRKSFFPEKAISALAILLCQKVRRAKWPL